MAESRKTQQETMSSRFEIEILLDANVPSQIHEDLKSLLDASKSPEVLTRYEAPEIKKSETANYVLHLPTHNLSGPKVLLLCQKIEKLLSDQSPSFPLLKISDLRLSRHLIMRLQADQGLEHLNEIQKMVTLFVEANRSDFFKYLARKLNLVQKLIGEVAGSIHVRHPAEKNRVAGGFFQGIPIYFDKYKLHVLIDPEHFTLTRRILQKVLDDAIENNAINGYKIFLFNPDQLPTFLNNPQIPRFFYTIYLIDDQEFEKVATLCRELEKALASLPVKTQKPLASCDLELLPHVYMRQTALDGTTEYIYIDNEETNELLAAQGRQSKIFQFLHSQLNAKPSAAASESKMSITTFFKPAPMPEDMTPMSPKSPASPMSPTSPTNTISPTNKSGGNGGG